MAKKTSVTENWISTADVARFFDVSERAVYNWMNTGLLPSVGKIGRQHYLAVEDVKKA